MSQATGQLASDVDQFSPPSTSNGSTAQFPPATLRRAQGNLNILSLDGGGIRGLSILFILQELMERIREEQNLSETPPPCNWFDLIVGTSTGGLIALMLGRLQMKVDAAIDAYRTLSEDVFGQREMKQSIFSFSRLISGTAPYSAEILKDAVQKLANDVPLANQDPTACKAAVVAVKARAAGDLPDLLRTYQSSTGYLSCTLADAARATTAATTFFHPAVVQVKHGLDVTYLDGGLGHNNPAGHAIDEAQQIWKDHCQFGSIVSIGTGTTTNVHFTGNKLKLAMKLVDIQTSCRKVHDDMERRFGGRQGVYFRFDVPTDLDTIGLDEWKKQSEVGELTHAYIQREPIKFCECVKAIIGTAATDGQTVHTPPNDSNPILQELKPGINISTLVRHLGFYMDMYTWQPTICNHLTQEQIGSFFCDGVEGCQRFMDYLAETDNIAVQYATLEIFKKDKRVKAFFKE